MRIAITRETSYAALVSESARASVALLTLDKIADPDYAKHPAYGQAFPPPALGLRLRALTRLAPWLFFAIAKQAFLGDRLPALSGDGDSIEGGLMRRLHAFPRYVPLVARTIWRNLSLHSRSSADESALSKTLYRDGITIARFTDDEREGILGRVAAPLREILARKDRTALQSFKGNQNVFTREKDGPLFDLMTDLFTHHGLMQAASSYLGRPANITRFLLQVNDPRDRFLYNSFPDVGLGNSRTDYMHIDRAYGCLKCVVYLSEVGERNGPFAYVLGSNRLKHGALGGIVRRAVDRAGLAHSDRETRRIFMALPRLFRKKSEFGCDLLDGSENSKRLLAAEYKFTSECGNVAIFDNLGIHRGAMVMEGQRTAMFITLA